ncbi:restriction endonuclease [Bacillus sp. FJAT-49705]|uniref:Restriction endonuclease n=1 Tax=Cytobacillus citreus TaxID=2833586 RepID=A0ABS5NY47_9BACI|nr:restriction endonuclease [Cytobacillus citreus]MBS4192774.1 restriction endonuclease [Cytobacillus citreus]
MGKRKYRRKNSWIQNKIEWVIICAVFFFALSNKFLHALQQFIIKLKYLIQSLTAVDWFLMVVIITSLILINYFYINNRKIGQRHFEQEQAKIRVLRDSEYQKLISMSPSNFEKYVADLFTTKGYDVELTPLTGDGGKDIILRKNKEISLVECKRYNQNNKVSRPEIQKFHSALIDMNAKEGYFVTTGYFTQPAMTYSIDKPIKLIDLPRLIEFIEEAKGSP